MFVSSDEIREVQRSITWISLLYVKINLGGRPIANHFCSVQLHVKRVHVRPLNVAHGLGRLGYGALRGFGKTVLGCSNHFNNLLSHSSLLGEVELYSA